MVRQIDKRTQRNLSFQAALHGFEIPSEKVDAAPQVSKAQQLAAEAAIQATLARKKKELGSRG
jgi:hypothetical protein